MNLNKGSHFAGIIIFVMVMLVFVVALFGDMVERGIHPDANLVAVFFGAGIPITFALWQTRRTETRKRESLCTAALIEVRSALATAEYITENLNSYMKTPPIATVAIEQLYQNLDLLDAETVYAISAYRQSLRHLTNAQDKGSNVPETLAATGVGMTSDKLIPHLLKLGAIDHDKDPTEAKYRRKQAMFDELERRKIEGAKEISEFFREYIRNSPDYNKD